MSKKKTEIVIDAEKYYSLPVVAKFLGYTSRTGILYHLEQGKIPKEYLAITRTIKNQRQMIKGEWVLKNLRGI